MNNLFANLMLIQWIISIVAGISFCSYSLIKGDKQTQEVSVITLITFILTGYITFIPATIAVIVFINNHKNEL